MDLRIVVALALTAGAAVAQHAPVSGDRPPALLFLQASDYPPQALAHGHEADVPCDVSLDADGKVIDADCELADEYQLARAAQRACKDSRFRPALHEGRPVPSSLRITYRFLLSPARLPEPLPEPENGGVVHGEVLAQGARAPVAVADVVAQGVGLAATTDGKGHFTLKLPPGSHVLVASAPNFSFAQTRVEVPADGVEVDATLYLRPKGVSELTATVQGSREQKGATRSTVQREELRNVPGTSSDPLRVIEGLPGLARVPFTGGQLIVRGSNARDTGAYIDGQRIPVLYHLLNGPSVLGEDMVDKIDFYPGGAGVSFGRNLAGVVSVQSRRGDADKLHGSAAVDLQKSAGFLEGPLGKDTQFAFGLRRSYVNPVMRFAADPHKDVTFPVYWDYQARLDHSLSAKEKLTFTAFGSGDGFDQVGPGRGTSPLELGQHVSFHRARLLWEKGLGDDVSLSVAPAAGWDVTTTTSTGAGPGVFARPQSSDETTLSGSLRSELAWRASPRLELRAGLDLQTDRTSYALDQLFDQQLRGVGAPNAEQRRLNGVKVFHGLGEYVETELKLGQFRLTPGVRFEQMHYAGNTYGLTDPRVWVRWSPLQDLTLHAYAGIYHQPPSAQQVDADIGNPRLVPLRAEQLGLGAEQRFAQLWTVRVEGYVARRSNLVFPATARILADGTVDNPLQVNSGIGRSVGLEVLIRRELSGRFYGWLSYTLSRSREIRRPGEAWLPTPYDQPHVLTLLVGARVSPFLELSTRVRLATGNPLAEATSATFDADSGDYVPVQKPFGSTRLPTFLQLDFEVNNVWIADLWRLSLYVDFQNVLGRDNPEILLYDYRYETQDTVHGLPFQASAGAKVTF